MLVLNSFVIPYIHYYQNLKKQFMCVDFRTFKRLLYIYILLISGRLGYKRGHEKKKKPNLIIGIE